MKKLAVILMTALVAGLLSAPLFACTTAIISAEASATGRPLLWKQRDTKKFYNDVKFIQGEKYSFTALVTTDTKELDQVWGGVNEKGFAIVNNLSYNITKDKEAFDNGRIMMEALAVCANVDEFEAFLNNTPVDRPVKANYAVIDAHGGAAYFEYGYGRCFRFDAKDAPGGIIYRTNFSFEGYEDEGSGYIRYEASQKLFGEKGTGFTPAWIFDNVARSFYHGLMKVDMKNKSNKELGEGFIIDQDYIPRHKTVSSIIFEGVNPGEDPRNVIIWTALGYPPCSYAIPSWVGAKGEIPSCLVADEDMKAPANKLANQLKDIVFPIKRGSGEKYLDYLTLRNKILPIVNAAEDKEFEAAEKLKKQFQTTGFDIEAVKKYNAAAIKRFEAYRKKADKILN